MSLTKVTYSMISGATVNALDYGVSASGTAASNKTAIELAIAALSSGGVITIPKGTYAFNPFTVASAGVTIQGEGPNSTSFTFATVGSNTNAVSITANNVAIVGIKFVGPSSATFVNNENCIQTNGTFATNRDGLTVANCEIYNFGSYGINAEYTNNITISDNYIHNVGYGGVFFRSCITGWIENNRISDITPGSSANMYGITLSHTDNPPPTSKTSSTHFCYGINITGNELQNIDWEGIDAHGAYEVIVTNNKVYNTKFGIAISSSSGASLNYAGWQNIISNNVVDARKKDGTTGDYMYDGYGININGFSNANVQNQEKVIVSGNIIFGKGVLNDTNTGSIQAEGVFDALISNNIIDAWAGVGILLANQTSAIVEGNLFGNCFATDGNDSVKRCVNWRAGAGSLLLVNNAHYADGGQTARYGFYSQVVVVIAIDGTNLALKTSGNNFNESSVNQMLFSGSAISEDAGVLYNHPQLTASSTVIDLRKVTSSVARVNINADAPVTVTGITGGGISGQLIIFVNIANNAITFTRSYAYLSGSANQILTNENDTIGLISGTSSTDWVQVSTTLSNG